MDFQPPETVDLTNVYSLNRAFLTLLTSGGEALGNREPRPVAFVAGLGKLDRRRRRRLAETPFLLFSLAENDVPRWRPVFTGAREIDMFDNLDRPTVDEARIVQAAIGFLWQLAKKRPYAARVISGASYYWCERLALCTLVDLFNFAANEPRLLTLRMADNAALWHKLVVGGTSDDVNIRATAKLSALQTVLTMIGDESSERLPAAACSMPAPSTRVAERAAVSQDTARGYNTPPDESAVDKKPD